MDQRVLKSKNLDARERTLLLEARNVALTPKALDTLIALVRSQPKVMSKEELLETVWPGTFVEEGILAQNIMTLRKALKNPSGSKRCPSEAIALPPMSPVRARLLRRRRLRRSFPAFR